jgi:hypothetical protein
VISSPIIPHTPTEPSRQGFNFEVEGRGRAGYKELIKREGEKQESLGWDRVRDRGVEKERLRYILGNMDENR